jgi:alanyl-tRNA synthetase
LTFDFSHASRVDTELLQVIEEEINQRIQDNLPVTTRIMPLAEAKATGAMALFDEKYGDQVRVVSIDGWSTELCGGTHVRHTGDIGSLLIVSETGIGSGLRRIEARTGQAAIQYHRQEAASLDALAKQLQTPVDTLGTRVEALLAEGADLKKTVTLLETELLRTQVEQIVAGAWHSDGVTAVASTIRASSVDALRTAGDLLLDKVGTGYVVLAAPQGDRALLLTAVSPELKENGVDANTLMKRLVKRLGAGGGGGNSRMATGSSPNLTALEPALRDARDELLAGVQRS